MSLSVAQLALFWVDPKVLPYDSTDIDECASGTHDCSSVALCLNTAGSYNCSCHDGYDGDGFNCTGTLLVDGWAVVIPGV